jgi:hypothetical protein
MGHVVLIFPLAVSLVFGVESNAAFDNACVARVRDAVVAGAEESV